MKYSLFGLLILVTVIMNSKSAKINIIHKWKYADYAWDSREQMEDAMSSGNYNPNTCFFYDAIKADDGRLFISLPRELGPGSPATFVTVSNMTGTGGPLLRPYPDWSWHNRKYMCDGIVNVHRGDIQCNYLFVLDNGKIGTEQICNPKLLIFNLKDDTLIKTIYIPIDIATNQTGFGLLVAPLVYVPGPCSRILDEMIVFMADMLGFGLVVYDASTKRMCRVESDYMKPTETSVSIANDNFTYVGGIFSTTIFCDDLYYQPISGKEIYKIKIKTLLECPNKEQANKHSKLMIKLSSQTGQITSTGHAILYSDSHAISIVGTNVCTKSDRNTVVLAQDSEALQAISAMRVSHFGKTLNCLSDRYQRYFLRTLNLNEINIRYFEMDLAEIEKETDMILPTTLKSWTSWLFYHIGLYWAPFSIYYSPSTCQQCPRQ